MFYFIVLLVSTFKLILSHFKSENEFIIFIICSMILLSMVFHSLVNIVMIRYTYTLFWIYYLSPIFLLIMLPSEWGNKLSGVKKAGQSKTGKGKSIKKVPLKHTQQEQKRKTGKI